MEKFLENLYNLGNVVLNCASDLGEKQVVKLMLERGTVNVKLKDENGRTPLLLTVEKEYTEIVELLLRQQNIDVNLVDKDGRTPLLLAVEKSIRR